jgi:hypothetical protein
VGATLVRGRYIYISFRSLYVECVSLGISSRESVVRYGELISYTYRALNIESLQVRPHMPLSRVTTTIDKRRRGYCASHDHMFRLISCTAR